MGVPRMWGFLLARGLLRPQDVGCPRLWGCWGGMWGCWGVCGGALGLQGLAPGVGVTPAPPFRRQEEAERRLPRRRLLLLARHEPVLRWVRDCDHALYQGLVEILVPDVLRPIPSEPPNPPDPPEPPEPRMDPPKTHKPP